MMELIHNLNSFKANKQHVDRFGKLYFKGFPDENEREDYETILKRVTGKKQPHDPHSLIVLYFDNKSPEVVGGMIADWYENSKSIHLIYLIIDEDSREKGISRILINDGVALIKDNIEKTHGIEIKNVFFESNNPEKTINDNFDPVTRLEIFSHLGGRLIDIPYVQPALDPKKKKVDNLYLLSFTQFSAKEDRIPASEIIAFLGDLYLSLGASTKDESFAEMQNHLEKQMNQDGDIVLTHIKESSFFNFHSASVTWHFVQKEEAKILAKVGAHFSSFEKDLMNFQNQKNAPFTSGFAEKQFNGKVIFPKEYKNNSEGRTHTKSAKVERVELPVVISVSFTEFTYSDVRIWHVTVAPGDNQYFTEYDLIKLSTLFGSTQEDSTVEENIYLSVDEVMPDQVKPEKLVFGLGFIDKDVKLENMKSGIVQIETSGLKTKKDLDSRDIYDLFKDSVRTSIQNEPVKLFYKALCGILLGIFDFDRMDDDEIFDTVQPILQSDTTFAVISRGCLLKIAENDEIMDSVSNHVIASPYILIPSMVLAYNEYILTGAKDEINTWLDAEQKSNLSDLEACESFVRDVLNLKYLDSVFQYTSEKDIIERGNAQRGITQIYDNILKRLEDLNKLIDAKKEKRANFSDAFLNAFLSFIAMIQINNIFIDNPKENNYIYLIYFIEVIISVVIFFVIRAKKIKLFNRKESKHKHDH